MYDTHASDTFTNAKLYSLIITLDLYRLDIRSLFNAKIRPARPS